ncbi:flagellar hook capping FlgD N-terminal domain-containing protein [Paracoccus aminophilus]|uniref:Basal-body rod modification protein FlgD n=1 Tax=Paracoccus aminophilus JCM 7686 TaxID=1367847 RepID=S5YCR4_PARAH|nr:flagellar hook capping FlgD N-terminal domain-containing protein [Paracoccus aminophilus]AGT09243.1 flagellar basal body rod modification protein [Paracoccus aminophilus JCM 7686]
MVNSVGGSTTNPSNGSNPPSAGGFSGGDYSTFLKMLTTQIKNQDPLNPMESTDFATQLATFSGVEQQVKTNNLLAELVSSMGGGGLSIFANWIGKEVRTTAPVNFSQRALNLHVEPHVSADEVYLVAYNSSGKEVTRDSIGPGVGEVQWLGTTTNGTTLSSGLYTFKVESFKKGEKLSALPVSVYTKVIGAEMARDGSRLLLQGGAIAYADEVLAIREAKD